MTSSKGMYQRLMSFFFEAQLPPEFVEIVHGVAAPGGALFIVLHGPEQVANGDASASGFHRLARRSSVERGKFFLRPTGIVPLLVLHQDSPPHVVGNLFNCRRRGRTRG